MHLLGHPACMKMWIILMIYINCEITINCAEAHKGPCKNVLRKFINFTKTNLKYRWEKIPEHGGKLISIFCAGQFQFDAFYSLILDFVSISVYWQLTSLFTSRIGQLWNLARLNDVRGISILSQYGENRWPCMILPASVPIKTTEPSTARVKFYHHHHRPQQ